MNDNKIIGIILVALSPIIGIVTGIGFSILKFILYDLAFVASSNHAGYENASATTNSLAWAAGTIVTIAMIVAGVVMILISGKGGKDKTTQIDDIRNNNNPMQK